MARGPLYPASITRNGQTTAYQYDSEGTRIRKTNADGSYIRYHVVDGRTVGHTEYDAGGARRLDMCYTFDQNGAPAGFSLKNAGETAWTEYYFVKNLQGDVLKVYKAADNSLAAAYTYDPFGKIRTSIGSLANTNPFRYRGYFYDAETGFYYVSSRYYDPEIGRWINADIPETLTADFENMTQYNLFAYCFNNPVNTSDETGTWPSWATKLLGAGLWGGIARD